MIQDHLPARPALGTDTTFLLNAFPLELRTSQAQPWIDYALPSHVHLAYKRIKPAHQQACLFLLVH
jgi:hypothetical protein